VGGRDFPHPFRPSLLYTGYRFSFPGVKRPGRGVDHPPPSSAEVKERVELYLYAPSGPSWPVLGRTLPLPLCVMLQNVLCIYNVLNDVISIYFRVQHCAVALHDRMRNE
jgi:hypothetical protein